MAKKKKDAADFARRANATSRMGRRGATPMPVSTEFMSPTPTRPTPRPSRAPAESTRPSPRPAGLAEQRDLRKAAESAAAALRGSELEDQDYQDFVVNRKAGGAVKKMAMGGKCRGMGAATRGGNFSRG